MRKLQDVTKSIKKIQRTLSKIAVCDHVYFACACLAELLFVPQKSKGSLIGQRAEHGREIIQRFETTIETWMKHTREKKVKTSASQDLTAISNFFRETHTGMCSTRCAQCR